MKAFKATGLAALMFGAFGIDAMAQRASSHDLYVVMFRSDTCAPCRILEPNLHTALRQMNDHRIAFMNIDLGTPEAAAHTAFDADIVPQYNQWLGITGFAAIIDADTKHTLGCVNMRYGPEEIKAHVRSLQEAAQQNIALPDLTCPAPARRI